MSENEEDDFARTSSNFMSWLQQRGISVSPKISLADLRDQDAGRGVGTVSLPLFIPCVS